MSLVAIILPREKVEGNCELRGTDNVQGQISVHIFEAKRNGGQWRLLSILSLKHFYPKTLFWGDLGQGVKLQNNYVASLFKTFSSILFNNLFWTKSKRATQHANQFENLGISVG